MGRHDERPTRLQSLLTDEPGVVVSRPRKQLARILVLYALLPLICAAAGAYIAYTLGSERTDRRIAATEQRQSEYLAERRRVNAAAMRQRDEQLAAFRRDFCVLIDRVQPRDREVAELRREYGCAAAGSPSPTPSAGTSPAAPSSSGGGTAGRDGTPAAPRPVPRPSAARPPARPPSTAGPSNPAPPVPPADDEPLLCVPLVDLCVP